MYSGMKWERVMRESSGGDKDRRELTVWYSSCTVPDVPLVAADGAINQGLSKLYHTASSSKMTNKYQS